MGCLQALDFLVRLGGIEPPTLGNPGRPKGAKDKVPRGSIKGLYAEILATDRQAVKEAIRKKLLKGGLPSRAAGGG